MNRWLKPIRAAIGMGLTWAAAWLGLGIITALGFVLITGEKPDPPVPMLFGFAGFLGGVTFSGVLSLIEGRRRFAQMSLPRFAAWGAAAGVLLSMALAGAVALGGDPGLLQNLPGLALTFAVAGAGSAAGSLALARGADGPEPLEAGEDMRQPGNPGGPGDG